MDKTEVVKIKGIANLDNFTGEVALFPLPSIVFFPHTFLPLKIFEPRNKQMVKEAMEKERMISMVLFKPGWDRNYFGNPDIYDIAGLGKIVKLEPIEDGKYNIVLYGLKRVRILEIVQELPYRVAKVEIMEEQPCDGETLIKQRIMSLVSRWNSLFTQEQEVHMIDVDPSNPVNQIADSLASSQIPSLIEKQTLLGELNVENRVNKILSNLETRYRAVSIVGRKRQKSILDSRDFN